MNKNPIIKVKDLHKQYKDLEAVRGVSFEIYEGEVFALLGPNGAGKTTTLEIIETLVEATSGSVEVDGLDVRKHGAEIKKRIGAQLQASGYYPGLKIYQLLNLFAGLYRVEVDIDAMLERVSLLEKKNSLYKNLSGGQKQRFSVCTTLINKPKIIFLDEPTTGLDPQARRNLWELIESINADGTTVVMTTHYMDEAEYLCDRVAIMDQGKILKVNTPQQLIDDLVESGFSKEVEVKQANLEDVFIDLTGKKLRE